MYAQEQHVDAPRTVEALRFTVQQYLRMRGPARTENNLAPQQRQQPVLAGQQNQIPAAAPQRLIFSNLHSSLRLTDSNHNKHISTVVTNRIL